MAIRLIDGGVCAAEGFIAGAVFAGIKKDASQYDLSIIYSSSKAACASVYTKNTVKSAPVTVTMENTADGYAQAIVCNSGNANAFNKDGVEIAKEVCGISAKALKISAKNVIVASCGTLGEPLSIEPFINGVPALCSSLSKDGGKKATLGIASPDDNAREIALSFEIGGKVCKMGGAVIGSACDCPSEKATLAFITTDCAISKDMLSKALISELKSTFDMISIGQDASTNDMITVLANGMAKNKEITSNGKAFSEFKLALRTVAKALSKMIAKGFGKTKLLECYVSGAFDEKYAKIIAKSVVCSSRVKSSISNLDANWGGILCAIGASSIEFDPDKADVSFISGKGEIPVCSKGASVEFSEEFAKEILGDDEITIKIKLGDGDGSAVSWGCS